jgi:hypothetical protein
MILLVFGQLLPSEVRAEEMLPLEIGSAARFWYDPAHLIVPRSGITDWSNQKQNGVVQCVFKWRCA